jgi:hypothetical protein
MSKALKAPFPYFGGKSLIADQVWARLGDTKNYVEPFAGSLAVLLARPHAPQVETVNDADGMLANFWRAVQHDPEAVACAADWPVNEIDIHARHAWLVGQRERITGALEGDPDWFDVRAAGWWVWGLCSWIGSGWCSGRGPWIVDAGRLVDSRQLPHLGGGGMGVNRKLPHLGGGGMGVNRKLPHLGGGGMGHRDALIEWFAELSERLRNVRVACGDWSRVCGPSVTYKHGMTAIFLDPPYADSAKRAGGLYAKDDLSIAHAVREWAIENGGNPKMRIALCGYSGEHVMPGDWECMHWKQRKGYGGQRQSGVNDNSNKERIWFSPHCMKVQKQGEIEEAA